jgi:hypothetical protein
MYLCMWAGEPLGVQFQSNEAIPIEVAQLCSTGLTEDNLTIFKDWLSTRLTEEMKERLHRIKVVTLKRDCLVSVKSAWTVAHFHYQFAPEEPISMHASTVDTFIGILHDDLQRQDSSPRRGPKVLLLDLTCGHLYVDRPKADQEAYVKKCFDRNAFYHDAQVFIMPIEEDAHFWYMKYSLDEEVVVVDSSAENITSFKYKRYGNWLKSFRNMWRSLVEGKKRKLPVVQRYRHAAPQQQEDIVSCGVFMCVWVAQEAVKSGPREVDVHHARLLLGASIFAGKNLM